MTGRPSDYSEAIAAEICRQIAEGISLRTICRADDMPASSTVFLWLSQRPEFSEQYARAREAQTEAMAEEIIEIADDTTSDTLTTERGTEIPNSEWISRSRLRVDSRKWLMAKLAPKKYGDKITAEHTGAAGGPMLSEITVRFVAPEVPPVAQPDGGS